MIITWLIDGEHNKQLITKWEWLTQSGTFRVNSYSWTEYAIRYKNSWSNQWTYLWTNYILQYTSHYNNDDTECYIVLTFTANNDDARESYELLRFSATTAIQSVYIDGSTIYFNYENWSWVFVRREFSLTTKTFWWETSNRYTTWTAWDNTAKSFVWYSVISDMKVVWWTTNWYTVTPYLRFTK